MNPFDSFIVRPHLSDPRLTIVLMPDGPVMFRWEDASYVFTETYRLDTGARLHRGASVKRHG